MIAIINYNSGNIASVKNALNRLDIKSVITDNPEEIKKAEKVIFPGVGRAGAAMAELKKRGLDEVIKNIKAPFLGICLGMQLLADRSEEDETQCLGVISGEVKRFSSSLKVPQIGWNKVQLTQNSALFKNISDNSYFYFVNSYYFDTAEKFIIGQTDYGVNFVSAVQKNNFYGVQFHPEKSGEVGLKVLRIFCELQG